MKQKKQLECQLHCKATAQLSEEIAKDLSKPDHAMAQLLEDKDNETKDKPDHSD